jgi:hypothetical protein
MNNADIQVKTGYGVVKTILIFTGEVIAVGGVMAPLMVWILKMAIGN